MGRLQVETGGGGGLEVSRGGGVARDGDGRKRHRRALSFEATLSMLCHVISTRKKVRRIGFGFLESDSGALVHWRHAPAH